MDTTEKELLAQEQMDQLKAALKKSNGVSNTGAVSGGIGAADTITLSGSTGQYNNSTIIGGGYSGAISSNYTTGLGLGANITSGINWAAGTTSITANPWTSNGNTHMSGKLNLEGDEADIVINGVSLMDILKDRLNVMIPNPALEKEWDQLRELGDQYRQLEKDLKEKAEIWKKLKD